MDIVVFSIIGIIIVFMVFLIIIVFRCRGKQNTVLEDISTALNAEKVSGGKYRGVMDGVEYTYDYYAGSKNSPSHFIITVPCKSKGKLKILKETSFDKFFKKLAIASEVQTRDKTFDDRFYIETAQPSFARMYLQMPERRMEITKIFNKEFTSLELKETEFVLTKSPFALKKTWDGALVSAMVKSLIELLKYIPTIFPKERPAFSGGTNFKIKRMLIFSTAFVAVVGGIGLTIWSAFSFAPLDISRVLFFSLQYSVPSCIVFVFISFMILRGRSRSHKELLMVFFLTLAAAGILGYGATAFYNSRMDTSSASTHHVLVLSKYYSKGKDSTTYYINVESWRADRYVEKFKVSSSLYHKLKQ